MTIKQAEQCRCPCGCSVWHTNNGSLCSSCASNGCAIENKETDPVADKPDHAHDYRPGNWYGLTDKQDRNDCTHPGCDAHMTRPHQEWNDE